MQQYPYSMECILNWFPNLFCKNAGYNPLNLTSWLINGSRPTVWKHYTSLIFYRSGCFCFACCAYSLTAWSAHSTEWSWSGPHARSSDSSRLCGEKIKRKIHLSSMLLLPASGTDELQVFLEINLGSGVHFVGGRKHFFSAPFSPANSKLFLFFNLLFGSPPFSQWLLRKGYSSPQNS